jgi:hypothetical protein
MKTDTTFVGVYPEIDIKDIHYCGVDNCPSDKFQIVISMSLSVPREELGDIVKVMKNLEEETGMTWNDEDKWEISIRKIT